MEDEELKKIVTNMVSAGESEENIALVIKNYKPKQPVDTTATPPVQPPPPQPEQPTEGTGVLKGIGNAIASHPTVSALTGLAKTAVAGTVGFAKSAWNTAANQVPMEYRLEDLRNSQGTLAGYLNPSKRSPDANIQNTKFDFPEVNSLKVDYRHWLQRQPDSIRTMDNEKRTALFLKQTVGEKKAGELAYKFNNELTNYRVKILDDVEQQREESESAMEGIPQSIRDVKTGEGFGKYLGGLGGQGVGRIASSILTGGSGSIIAERAAGYEGQLDKMAKMAADQTGISVENAKKAIIKLNTDKPEAGRILSDLAGALDVVSIPVMASSKIWGKAIPMIFEMATEIGQSEIEEKVATMGAGTEYEYDPVRSLDSGLGAMVGAKTVQVVTDAIGTVANTGSAELNKIIDNAAGLTPAEAEQLNIKPTTNAVQEQSTSSQVPYTGEAGQDIAQSSEGVRPSQQGQEVTTPLIEEEKLNQQTNEKETGIQEGGESGIETVSQGVQGQGEKGGQQVNKQKEEVLTGNQVAGTTPATHVTPKIASNPRYKAQKEIADQALTDAVVDGKIDLDKLDIANEERNKLKEIAKDLTRKQVIAEEKASSDPVVTNIAKLREEFYKTLKEGGRLTRKEMNNLLKQVTDLSKSHKATETTPAIPKHKLTTKQVNTLVNLVRRTNVNSKKHRDKFEAKVKEIIGKADYAETLDTAERLRDQIKKKTRGSLADKVHNAGRKFAKIEPGDLDTNELGAYISHAHDLVNHYKNVTSKVYAPASSLAIETFSDKTNANQRDAQIQAVRDQFGFTGDGVTDEEILDYIKNEEEGNFQEDPFAKNKKDTEKKIVRDELMDTAEYAQLGLKEKKFDNKEHQTKADRISQMDLSELSNGQLSDYIRTTDKMVENDDFSGTDRLDAMAIAIEESVKLEKQNEGQKLGKVGVFKRNVYSLPLIFKAIYTFSKYAAEAYRLSGMDGYFKATGRVENQMHKLDKAFEKKSKELGKNKGFNEPITQVDASIFGTLVRHPEGVDPVEALTQAKVNIEASIERYKGKEDYQDVGRDAEIAYAKFKNAKSIDEVFTIMKKESPGAYEMWKFWNDGFDEKITDPLQKVTEEYHNKPYVKQKNYTPGRVVNFDHTTEQLREDGGGRGKQRISEKAQATTSMPPTGRLGTNQAVDLNFYSNNRRGWKESLESIEVTKPKQILREFLMLPKSADLLGGEKNRQALIGSLNRSDEIAKSFGGGVGDKILNEVSHGIKQYAVTKALGGVFQFAKQYPSVAVSTMWNLGTDSDLFITTKIPKGADALFDQYPISNRGARLGGTEEGTWASHRAQTAYTKGWLKTFGDLNDFGGKGARIFLASLREGDVRVAKRSWAAYYLKSLKDSGIDIKNINLAEEANLQDQEVRQKAGAYASQKVSETQMSSNPDEMAKVLKTKPGLETAVKDILIPFSSFSINSKMRGIEAVNAIVRNPKKGEPWRELGAIASEIAAYNGIKAFLLESLTTTLLKPAIESMFGVEGEDKDEEEVTEKQVQKFWSGILKDASPLAIGSEGTSFTIQGANWLHYLVNNPDITYQEWKDKKNEYFTNYTPKGVDYGLYGIAGDAIDRTKEDLGMMYDIANDEDIYIQNQWGGEDRVTLTPEQENFMIGNMLFEFLSNSTAIDADLYNTFQRIKREQLKMGEKKATDYDERRGIERSKYDH